MKMSRKKYIRSRSTNYMLRNNTIGMNACVLILVVSVNCLETEGNTTPLPVTSVGVQLQSILPDRDRSGKCGQGSFDHSDGLMRYFECCREGELNEIQRIAECPCLPGGYCEHQTKTCRCHAGRTGEYCRNRCNPGFYGIECVEMCTCADGTDCDGVNGVCSCPEGNLKCKKCIDGLYGPTCKIPCICKYGNTCDDNGDCLRAAASVASGSSSSHYYEVAVALGVILALVVLTACIIKLFCYFMKKKSNVHSQRSATAYRGINSCINDVPFDIGIGRDSVNLEESPGQPPRNLSGLMRYLNTKQHQRQDSQTSTFTNRELPNIPDIDVLTPLFLAADGTQQPMADPELISPTLTSAQSSFDVPCHADGLTDRAATNTLPLTSQLNPPHIVINEHTGGPSHETPDCSPTGSLPFVVSSGFPSYSSQTLPMITQHRSLSTPGISPSFYSSDNGSDYDQLDRSHRRCGPRSFASCPSSAGDSGSENNYHTLRNHRRMKKNVSKGSIKRASQKRRKFFSFEKLQVKFRTEESDTESEYLLHSSHSHGTPESLSPASSEDPLSSTWPMIQFHNHLGGGFQGSGSPTRRDTSQKDSSPYFVTTLPDLRPQKGGQFDANSKGYTRNSDYETPNVSPKYAKPAVKQRSNANRTPNRDYYVLNRFNSDDSTRNVYVGDSENPNTESKFRIRSDDYENPIEDLRKPSQSIQSSGSDQHGALTQREQNDYKSAQNAGNSQDTGSAASGSDEKEGLLHKSRNDFESVKSAHFKARVDDYETPMVGVRQSEGSDENAGKLDANIDLGQEQSDKNASMSGIGRPPRVDDYETPMIGIRKPLSTK